MTVPRKCLFGRLPSQILEWDYGELYGEEPVQVIDLARIVKVTQGLDYKVGPALVVEDFQLQPKNPSTDPELLSPVRIAAMLQLLEHIGGLGDARVVLQNRNIAKETATDERLKTWGFYTRGSDHIRDATRIAITALRRARQSEEFRDELWDAQACTL